MVRILAIQLLSLLIALSVVNAEAAPLDANKPMGNAVYAFMLCYANTADKLTADVDSVSVSVAKKHNLQPAEARDYLLLASGGYASIGSFSISECARALKKVPFDYAGTSYDEVRSYTEIRFAKILKRKEKELEGYCASSVIGSIERYKVKDACDRSAKFSSEFFSRYPREMER